MAWVDRVRGGVRALVRRRAVEQELDDELRAYLDASIDAKVAAGMAHADAVRAARVEIGSVEAVKDRTRDAGWETRLEHLWRDGRYAMRTLRRSPAFAAVAVVTLTLGIGANTAIFSVVNAILLRPLRVERPEELIALAVALPEEVDANFSYAAYRQLAAEGAGVADAMAASSARRDAVTIDGPPEPVDQKWVSGGYFATLGVHASIGRMLQASDDLAPPGEAVAVLSDAYWARRWGRDPSVVGRRVQVRGTSFTIVGVAARTFAGETVGEAVDLWMPLTARPGAPPSVWRGHSTTWLRILARRRRGVTLEEARAALTPIYERIREQVAAGAESAAFRQSVRESRLAVSAASGGSSRLRDNLSLPLGILMAIVALVLVVVCANVANLMLARGAARRRETAVCLAIGAGRLRVVRHGVAEALVLAALGGMGGLLLAARGGALLVRLVSGVLPLSLEIGPDLRVLAFTTIVSCATAVVFGLLPALRTARIDPLLALKAGGGAGGGARMPLGRTLVVTQVAVSLVLLVLAGLFVRSLARLETIDPGFDPNHVLLLQLTPPVETPPVSIQERQQLYRELLARAERVPGVRAASASFAGPFTRWSWGNAISVEGVTWSGATPRASINAITPRYFEVMRIPIVRGRPFGAEDRDTAPRVVLVSQAFARRFFGEGDAIGRRVGLCTSDPCERSSTEMRTVVGVAADAKYVDLREPPAPRVYVPFTQHPQTLGELEVRTIGAPAAIVGALHRELAAADRRVAIVSTITLRDQVDASIVSQRLMATLSAAFGLLALALAAVGLYGVVAYVTAARTSEIGIRMALGADRRDVRRLVLRDTLALLALGVAIGAPAAIAGGRLVASLLHDVAPYDPLALTAGLATLVTAALVAGLLPARRAALVDPAAALRAE